MFLSDRLVFGVWCSQYYCKYHYLGTMCSKWQAIIIIIDSFSLPSKTKLTHHTNSDKVLAELQLKLKDWWQYTYTTQPTTHYDTLRQFSLLQHSCGLESCFFLLFKVLIFLASINFPFYLGRCEESFILIHLFSHSLSFFLSYTHR